MPAPANTSDFLDLVQKSGVVDEVRLHGYVQPLRDSQRLPGKPAELAGAMVRDAVLTSFQAEQLLLGKWKRFSIGKYKVLERIGTGGMGQVFLCEHKLMRRRVAVKVLPTAKADNESSLERFYREARAVASLDHPNLVRAHDIDQEESLHFLVMEYIDGTNLHDLVKKHGPLSPLRAAHYAYQTALGLDYAFECAGLIHRDIKPGNILVDRGGAIKILDMGLARFFHDEEDVLTKKYDETLGTADYLAPEQAVDSHCVDVRADIYSLGATMYFLLTGTPPFADGTVAQKLLWHQTRQAASLASKRPDAPPALVAIVERMMMKDPAERYQSPRELAEALEPFVQTPIDPPTEAELPRLSPAARLTGNGVANGASRVPFAANVGRSQANSPARQPRRPAATKAANPDFNPYANLQSTNGAAPSGPDAYARVIQPSPVAKSAPAIVNPEARRTRWLLPALTLAVIALVGSLFLRQLGLARTSPGNNSSPPAALAPG